MEIKYKAIDLMERTMANLQIMDELHAECRQRGAPQPYEVKQLVNSFLGALSYPWEQLRTRESSDEPWNLPMSVTFQRYQFPELTNARRSDIAPTSLRDVVRQLINGIAHGNIEFYSDHRREIVRIEIWNNNRDGNRTWGTYMSITELRKFLDAFYAFARDPFTEMIVQQRDPEG